MPGNNNNFTKTSSLNNATQEKDLKEKPQGKPQGKSQEKLQEKPQESLFC
jgi:hypothetical protein